MQAFISHESPRSLTAGVSLTERCSLSNAILFCRVGRRLTTRSQTIVIILDFVLLNERSSSNAGGQVEKSRSRMQTDNSSSNLVETIIQAEGVKSTSAKCEIFKSPKLRAVTRIGAKSHPGLLWRPR